jgi:hypothetical protein
MRELEAQVQDFTSKMKAYNLVEQQAPGLHDQTLGRFPKEKKQEEMCPSAN